MKYFLGKFFTEENVSKSGIPDEEVTRRLRKPRPSVSFSVAYSVVCEWAAGKREQIPSMEEFEMATKWARDLDDNWLLEQIDRGKELRIERENKDTPQAFARPENKTAYSMQPNIVEEVPLRVFKKDSRWEGDDPTTRRVGLPKDKKKLS